MEQGKISNEHCTVLNLKTVVIVVLSFGNDNNWCFFILLFFHWVQQHFCPYMYFCSVRIKQPSISYIATINVSLQYVVKSIINSISKLQYKSTCMDTLHLVFLNTVSNTRFNFNFALLHTLFIISIAHIAYHI